jgi:hypothetical protein
MGMNDIEHKDVETYVQNLIFEKFKSRQGDAKDRYQSKERHFKTEVGEPGASSKKNRTDNI